MSLAGTPLWAGPGLRLHQSLTREICLKDLLVPDRRNSILSLWGLKSGIPEKNRLKR